MSAAIENEALIEAGALRLWQYRVGLEDEQVRWDSWDGKISGDVTRLQLSSWNYASIVVAAVEGEKT